MTGKGRITQKHHQQTKLVTILHFVWMALLCVLVLWWGSLLISQAERIEILEAQNSSTELMRSQSARTHRMVFWESAVFLLILSSTSILSLWLYRRENIRKKSLESFFAALTHELRTPLTSIRLQTEAIVQALPDLSADSPLMKRLLEDTSRLEHQVERALELVRVEGGAQPFIQPLRLRTWVQRIVESISERPDIRIQTRVNDDALIQCDAGALQVILKNLFENSLRHAKTVPLEIQIESFSNQENTLLRFYDNGRGFSGDPKVLGNLFHRGPESHGSGVGLYLIKTLMERMGGSVKFDGSDGFRAELSFRGEVPHA